MKKFLLLTFVAIAFLGSNPSHAFAAGCSGTGNCYWVGGTGSWSDTAHWATSSGGATTGGLPTASDNAIFDAGSNTTNAAYSVTVDTSAVMNDLNFSAKPGDGLGGTITWAGSSAMAVSGNVTLLSGMTTSYLGTLTMNGASGTKTITSNTAVFGNNLTFNGGAIFQLADALAIKNNVDLTLTAGTFDANGQTVTLQGVNGPQTITGAFTFANLTRNAITAAGGALVLSNDIAVTGTFTVTGSNTFRLMVRSDTAGTARTITAGAVALSDVDFQDITGAGAAAPFTGTRIGDAKGNTNITTTPAANKYWVGGTGNWNGTEWATSSGGAAAATNVPLPQDTAIFDASSFSSNGLTVTINGGFRIGSILMSGTDQTFTLTNTTSAPVIYGDITLESNVTIAGTTGTYTYSGRTTQTITSAGESWTQPHTVDSLGGTVVLGDTFTLGSARTFTLTNGTLDLNGKTLAVDRFSSSNSNVRTIKSSLAGGKISTTDTTAATVFTATTVTNLTVDRSTAVWTIEIGGNTTNVRTAAFGSATWPAVSFTNTTANGELDITGSPTLKSLSVANPPQTIRRTAATTLTIEDTNGFPSGTLGNLVTIGSITASNHTWAKSGGGTISSDFLSLSRSTGSPASTWYAGTNSTDGGNNSGWIFTDAPTPPVIPIRHKFTGGFFRFFGGAFRFR